MSQSISETTTTCLSISTSVYIEPIALAENFGAAIDIYSASATATGITITNAGTLDGEISASGPLALGIAEANFDTKAPHYSSITTNIVNRAGALIEGSADGISIAAHFPPGEAEYFTVSATIQNAGTIDGGTAVYYGAAYARAAKGLYLDNAGGLISGSTIPGSAFSGDQHP